MIAGVIRVDTFGGVSAQVHVKRSMVKTRRQQDRPLSHGERDRVRGVAPSYLNSHPSPGPQAGRPLPMGEAGLRLDLWRFAVFFTCPQAGVRGSFRCLP